MENIKFIKVSNYKMNFSLITFLSNHEYKFEPINPYDRERFYCMIKGYDDSNFERRIKQLMRKIGMEAEEKHHFCPLAISCACLSYMESIPLVFNRKEVLNIISDVPEKYIGGTNI